MRRLSWRTKEIAKTSALALATLGIFVLAKLWPQYEVALWVGFGAAIAGHLYLELRQPVNYKSIVISKDAVEYTGLGGTDVIRFDQIATLQFVREQALFPDLYGPYLESKWLVHLPGGKNRKYIEVMDEWPHRRKLLRAFEEYLPAFDSAAAKQGLRTKKEGKWLCYEVRPNGKDGSCGSDEIEKWPCLLPS